MREVCVFLCPSLYKGSAQFIRGLTKNDIGVTCFDVNKEEYDKAIQVHWQRIQETKVYQTEIKCQPKLCLAFENSRRGIRAAKSAGMCAIGIASNHIELDRLRSEGAHAVALSIAELLDDFHVRNYYQVIYLPYAIQLRCLAEDKVGYPVSLLDTLSGRFLKHSDNSNFFELDHHSQRIIPREILGISPHSLADVYINNIGWPQDNIESFHLDTHELEIDIIRMFGRFYGCPDDFIRGFITNGGTEGNFTGLWWGRDYLQSNGERPIMLTSNQSHYSISKAAQQLAIEGQLVKTAMNGCIDCDDLACILDELARDNSRRPILMNINIGTTQTGAIDDLPRIQKMLIEKVKNRGVEFSIHVDAALMGAFLPIVNPFGKVDYFRDLDVKSIAISGHKFFGSVCICGVCLTTAPFLDACFQKRNISVGYITGLHDMTPSGSRSGFSTLSLHNTLCGLYMHTDAHRLRLLVQQCYSNVAYFIQGMSQIVHVESMIHPDHSLNVCFPRPSELLMSRYQLMPVTLPHSTKAFASVCILVNVNKAKIDQFLADYSRDMLLLALPQSQKVMSITENLTVKSHSIGHNL